MPGKPRGIPFQKGNPGGPGRPPGAQDRVKVELNAWLREMASDPEWRESFRRRAIKGDPQLDKEIIMRASGKVPDILHLETPAPLVVDLVAPGEARPEAEETEDTEPSA